MPRKLVVPDKTKVAKKWGDVTPGRSTYYEENTAGKGKTWEDDTAKAAPTFKAAVTAANIQKLFEGGVKGKAAKFERKVKDVGVGRFGPGVTAAVPDMESGVDPYLTVMAGTEVPDRGPRGSDTNYSIGKAIGDPLHKKRLALLGATS